MWTDTGGRVDTRSWIDACGGVNACNKRGFGFKQRSDFCIGRIRIAGDQCAALTALHIGLAQHHHAGAGVHQLRAIARVGEEGQLRGAGVGKGADTCNCVIFPTQLQPKARSQH